MLEPEGAPRRVVMAVSGPDKARVQFMGVDKLRLGRNQPFFHCLVDERDRPGAVTTYVAQVSTACICRHTL